jgi:hypothetical protein
LAAASAGGAAGALPFGLSAVAGKAIAVTAATALLAGGAVEVKKITATHPSRHAAAGLETVEPPAPTPQTGGASLPPAPAGTSDKPEREKPVTKREKSDETKASEAAPLPEGGTSLPAESTDAAPVGTTVPDAPIVDGQVPPADGAPPPPAEGNADTGGVSAPPPSAAPSPTSEPTTPHQSPTRRTGAAPRPY